MSAREEQIGRLAMRQEGSVWVAYYAMPNKMNDAIFLGSIRMGAVTNNADRKQAFMDMMRGVVSEIIEQNTGTKPTWDEPEAAAEHERSGSA